MESLQTAIAEARERYVSANPLSLAADREACRLILRRPGKKTSPARFNPATT